jgi:hypothetical protein
MYHGLYMVQLATCQLHTTKQLKIQLPALQCEDLYPLFLYSKD